MAEFTIPDAHWSEELSTVMRHIGPGDVIVVPDADRRDIALRAMELHNVHGVEVLIHGEERENT